MALYEIAGEGLKPVVQTTFTELGWRERQDIQRAVRAHIAAITPGVKTMVLAEEFGDWVGANRRIDLLCLDEQAQLVVVELKREDGAHMELQALRYAAMVSTMRFDQAVEAHRKYLESIGSTADPEQSIREFLEREEGPVALSETVRIVLAASDFPQELTTAVLWLNKQGLDLRCVQMRPHQIDGRVLIDIQQVIPLPEAEQYQVAVREKSMEQAAARAQERDMTRYDLSIGDATYINLPKRRLIYEVVAEAIRRGVTINQITDAVPWKGNIFVSVDGELNEQQLQAAFAGRLLRNYTSDDDLFHIGGKTYAFSTQWGSQTLRAVDSVIELISKADDISFVPTSAVADEVPHGEYVIRQRENGAIEIERQGRTMQPVMPILRDLADQLNVSLLNGKGNELNTHKLGERVIKAVRAL
ncbi:hypothetical protein [Pandoraea apista]|uniref:Endonuclease NucS n=1 Tax=Pandoraea apista TaxID=93218 RepID=A0ABX9ZHJ2_9BURK|nr:hypothetical protein [Pandoraea apista]PTD98341.1 hypothetical protein C7830_24875 [Pandoraea apista]RRJ25330.1 hypothetical protein EIB05_24260 [Pandoraea apista]RRJ72204.1 hypothetical protein EIL82_24140 [Pandoraea apista]RSC95522.1 hypothetical protein EJB12_25295 [Pandoraea apista]RSD08316.1 hypothetical protein EIZ52_24600 [Pandoraea apista]